MLTEFSLEWMLKGDAVMTVEHHIRDETELREKHQSCQRMIK